MSAGQARPDRLALKPYWGKPTVRNFREGDGNVGIIRSPVRAIALPDLGLDVERHLPALSTYLGHGHVADTYWYVSAVPELLRLAAARLEARGGRA